MSVAVKVEGLREFQRNLKKLDSDLPKALRLALNDAADVVVSDARSLVPRRSGRAAGTIRAKSTQRVARVSEGGSRAPYMPWLDFGGRVGRRNSVIRRVLPEGRYLYRAYFDHRDQFKERLNEALLDVVRRAGLEVD